MQKKSFQNSGVGEMDRFKPDDNRPLTNQEVKDKFPFVWNYIPTFPWGQVYCINTFGLTNVSVVPVQAMEKLLKDMVLEKVRDLLNEPHKITIEKAKVKKKRKVRNKGGGNE